MRSVLPRAVKERARTLARDVLGLDIRFARARGFDLKTYEMTAKYTSRLLHFEQIMRQIEDVEGRIVECGVGPGRSIFAFSLISQSLGHAREIWGFDTFRGLPPPTPEDGKSNTHKTGWFSYSQGQVTELLRYNGIDQTFISENIRLFPGTFSESLPNYDGGPIALLHIDVDFYESYKAALELLWEFVAPGGITAFDEYRNPSWPGATQAIDEFFADLPEEIAKSPVTELYYVVKKGNRPLKTR